MKLFHWLGPGSNQPSDWTAASGARHTQHTVTSAVLVVLLLVSVGVFNSVYELMRAARQQFVVRL